MEMNHVPQSKKMLPTRGIQGSYQIWIEEKAQRDSQLWNYQQNHWYINGKIYDLTNFIPNHPGGSHWLEYTKGQNITQHYIVHHLNLQKTDKILEKYEVKNYQGKQIAKLQERYTFDEKGLYNEVKKRLLQKYSVNQLQDSSKTQKIGLTLFLFWLISLILTGYLESYWMGLLCGYLMIPVTGIAHNFVHMKNSWFKYFYLVTGFTPKQWQIMHCISHHEYTNTLLDYELQAYEPLAYFLRIMPENTILKVILIEIAYVITIPLNIALKLLIVPIAKRIQPEWLYMVPLTQILLMYLINGDLLLSIKLFLMIHCFFGYVFTKVTFGGHRIETLWNQGCKQIKDFGQNALYTCNDIHPELKGGFLSFLVISGFNIHTVHHMFPTIDNQHLYRAHDILIEVCKQRNLQRSEHSLIESIISVYKNYFYRKQWQMNKNIKNKTQ